MKKAWNVISNILVWLLVVVAVGMMIFTIISVRTFDRSHRSIFGHQAFIVRSDSMSATDFKAGDLIFTKKVDPATLQEGDIIAYISQANESYGETITHKIRSLTVNGAGEPGFVTYGTTTGQDDAIIVTYGNVVGKYTGHIPGVGSFFMFMKTTTGYIVCIFIPFMLLILMQVFHCVSLFRQYKQEENEKLEQQKQQLAEERKKNEEMMQKLQAMYDQVSNAAPAAASEAPAADPAPPDKP